MFSNYLTVALRNLARRKLYSIITLSGLALGLASAIFIILFVRDELSWDRWLPGTERLYRLETRFTAPGRPPQKFATTPFMLSKAMRDKIPEVTGYTRLSTEWMSFTNGPKQFHEQVASVEPNFFTVIRLPLVAGDPARVLAQPQSVVLSETTARKYFGDANPLGQTLAVSRPRCVLESAACPTDAIPFTVTGVFEDIPHNSQLAVNIIIPNTSSAETFEQPERENWLENIVYSYVTLAPGADPRTVLAKLDPILDREAGASLSKINIRAPRRDVIGMYMTPFLRVHLEGADGGLTPSGSWTTVYGVIAIGVLIMLMACFNFTNLATAQATLRAREIAIRKAVGARRTQIVGQFLGEAVLLALLALVLAMAIVEMLLPAFDSFLERPIGFGQFADWRLAALVLAVAVTAGVLGGSYPALVLSGFRPAPVLRGGGGGKGGSGLLRTVLVVAQFAVSIALGIATVVVFSQIGHARRVELGFRHDNVLILWSSPLTSTARDSLMQELAGYPGIEAVAQANDFPFDNNNQSIDVVQLPGRPEKITLSELNIGPTFRSFYGIPLIAGRDLMRERADDQIKPGSANDPSNDGHNVVVNAAAAARLGLEPSRIVGKTLILAGSHVHVIGVIGDAKLQGAREPAKPTLYYFYPDLAQTISLRIRPDRVPDTVAFVDRTWHAFSPTTAVSSRFLDEDFEGLYRVDERQGQMFGVFVGLAILIAALGLFGLAAFTAGRRTREIGVRKVFGASTGDVVLLLMRQFSMPVLAANLIAWPVAWLYLSGWLEGFADRITLSPLYFIAVGAAALIIAWATIFVHTLRVASANPARALRYE